MQHRMRTHILNDEQISALLNNEQNGCIATLNEDGTPYVVPVHFLYMDGSVYFHGLPKGQKISNIKNNPAVSMCIYSMEGLITDDNEEPCDTNTKYQSVVIDGLAEVVENRDIKIKALAGIVNKYTPQFNDKTIPDKMINGTTVICIKVNKITGKYY